MHAFVRSAVRATALSLERFVHPSQRFFPSHAHHRWPPSCSRGNSSAEPGSAGMSPGRSTRAKRARESEDQLQPNDQVAPSPNAENEDGQARPAKKPAFKKPKPLVLTNSVEITPQLQAKALAIAQQLEKLYPNPPIPLDHKTPFQLLVAVMLSAQSTDVKVNEVTPALFAAAPEAAALAAMAPSVVEGFIKVLGLAPTKAKNLVGMSKMLMEQHNGEVPDTFAALEALPGVGHKTASVVLSQVFNRAAFPVDTHIHRLAQRWGLTRGRSVEQTEADLKALLPEALWRDVHLQIIYFGRQHCPALRHTPADCAICSWAAVPPCPELGPSPSRPGRKPAAGGQRAKKVK